MNECKEKDIKTYLTFLLCRSFWEVQVERRLRRAKQLVWQVHVDIWTKKEQKQRALGEFQYLPKEPKTLFHSLYDVF